MSLKEHLIECVTEIAPVVHRLQDRMHSGEQLHEEYTYYVIRLGDLLLVAHTVGDKAQEGHVSRLIGRLSSTANSTIYQNSHEETH